MDFLNSALSSFGADSASGIVPQIQALFGQFLSKSEARTKLEGFLAEHNIPLPVDEALSWLGANGMTEEQGDQIKGTPALGDLASKFPELMSGLREGGIGGAGDMLKSFFQRP